MTRQVLQRKEKWMQTHYACKIVKQSEQTVSHLNIACKNMSWIEHHSSLVHVRDNRMNSVKVSEE